MALVVILALGFVLLVGGVGKITQTFKDLFKKHRAECSKPGIKGMCACAFNPPVCPSDTEGVTSTDCPADGYGTAWCSQTDAKFKQVMNKAQADNLYGHCCYERVKQSVFA